MNHLPTLNVVVGDNVKSSKKKFRESRATMQTIHIKCQASFPQKNKTKTDASAAVVNR